MLNLVTLIFTIVFHSVNSYAQSWGNRGGTIYNKRHNHNHNWRRLASSEKESTKQLLDIVATSVQGQQLIDKARMRAAKDRKDLLDVIQSGDTSITDTTLVRKFSPSSPENVRFESRSRVYIDRGHSTKNAVLDLIHELTHYIYKKPFNPYAKDFSVSKFLVDTIQGKGGEVDAFLVECKIGKSIYGMKSVSGQCGQIYRSGEFSRELAVKEFYKLGNYYDRFRFSAHELKIPETITRLSSRESTSLISSAWSKPYPVAVVEEYKVIMEKVCHNDLRRLTYFKDKTQRAPASLNSQYMMVKNDFDAKCSQYFN